MAWRRPVEPVHVEPPSWYRTFDLAGWDAPDGHELSMIAGWGPMGCPWPDELHEQHARRRWAEAKHAYRGEHPELAEQELEALINDEWRARERERNG